MMMCDNYRAVNITT